MVRIINYKKRQAEDKEFFVLEVSGGIEMVLSQTTNHYYATAKKATITSTFDEETCKTLIGSELAGNVVKLKCDPYEFTIKETGEIVTLNHRYVYLPEENDRSYSHNNSLQSNLNDFSANGNFALVEQ